MSLTKIKKGFGGKTSGETGSRAPGECRKGVRLAWGVDGFRTLFRLAAFRRYSLTRSGSLPVPFLCFLVRRGRMRGSLPATRSADGFPDPLRNAEEKLHARQDPDEHHGGNHHNPKNQIQKKSPSYLVHSENIASFPHRGSNSPFP